MAKPFEMYVFDWDGTLMDTTRLIMQGYQHASKALGFPVPSDELVLSTIGLNRSDSIALCCCDCPKGRYAEFIQAYMDWYASSRGTGFPAPLSQHPSCGTAMGASLTNLHKAERVQA